MRVTLVIEVDYDIATVGSVYDLHGGLEKEVNHFVAHGALSPNGEVVDQWKLTISSAEDVEWGR